MGIENIRTALSGQLLISIVSSITSLVFFFQLFYFSTTLALVGGCLAVLATLPLFLGLVKLPLERKLQAEHGKLSGLVQEILLAMAKLRVSGSEERAFTQWAQRFARVKKLAYQSGLIQTGVSVWDIAYTIISVVAIYSVLMFINRGAETISVGRFIAFNSAFGMFLAGVLSLTANAIGTLSLVSIYERSKPILKTIPETSEALEDPGELSGSLEVSKVSFRYDMNGPMILKDVSLRLEPGQFLALVGPSGSGKSTLLRLLLRFEKPEAGSIYYDQKELANLDIRALRRQIGVALQNSLVLPGTLFENIIGSLPLSHSDAMEAAAMAGLDKDIAEMPMGLHTMVSEGGGTLSGGQIQRLIIARALVTKPRLLFFDEATSALDNQTQAKVNTALDKLRITRLVIAHRLSTVINADRILVIDQGAVVETGTYDELMSREGVFFRLASRQMV
jgi:ABC-type bacteriocin/lantibiotic exporter with double-glycine peptidase domain